MSGVLTAFAVVFRPSAPDADSSCAGRVDEPSISTIAHNTSNADVQTTMDGVLARTLTADRGDAGTRLDLVVRRHLSDLSAATRTRVQSWIEDGRVCVNGSAIRRV